ncbi:AAA family ATPase [Nocardioides euryhalodurans]|uniref:AAA family ATPase n=1 Tax=Nocardioides euryhalodurans TaxID=2518370 RepID=UPI00141FB4F8|nr:AAA family ATPase [Nocardioides euryhalodurans]
MGRDGELQRIAEVLADAAAGRCSTLLLEGDPGVGKTTLLEAARAMATGFTCLTARGAESDSSLAHAGLLELCSPVRDLLSDLAPVQAEALTAALGWSDLPSVADRFLVAAATMSLLAAAAERGPVLVLVDDLQWLDRESAAALTFAARRLGPDAVAFVATTRPGGSHPDLTRGLALLPVVGLATPAVASLLPPGTASAVVEDLRERTGGNPLALLAVAEGLDDAQRVGAAPLPDPLPAGDRVGELHRATISGLSPAASEAALLLAVAGRTSDAAAAVATVLTTSGVDVADALDEARDRGVLAAVSGRPEFRHPLLRSAVLSLAPPSRIRAAHRALAGALPAGDRSRTWHRAYAVTGPDASLATELAAVAEADRDRLGHAAASAALERASELTPDRDLAAHRLAGATHDAFVAGDVARVRVLAGRLLSGTTPEEARGEALLVLGTLEQYAGSVPLAVEHLEDASQLLRGAMLVRSLTELAMARFRLNDVAGLVACATRVDEVVDPGDPEQQLQAHFVGGVASVLTGHPEEGLPRLAEVRRLADEPRLRHDAGALLLMALAVAFTGEMGDAVTVGTARMQDVRRRGAIGVLVPLLAISAAGRAWVGDHTGAFADSGEAAELAAHLGYAADASVAVEMLAWQQAARGSHEEARTSLARARELTDRAGTTPHAAHQALTAAFCALCRGDLAEVVALLEPRLALDGGVGASGEPLGVAPLLVEAYLGLGRVADARALTDRYAAATPAVAPPLSTALLQRCRALTLEDPAAATAAFEAALAAHEAALDPFETARTRLLHGGRLRRSGQRVAAREQLELARSAFTSMDLTHWATVASQELAGTGATARRGDGSGDAPLTSQETRVSLLAAQGLSNREIGAALFLSPKTVERHLSNVFRKRGFRSRTELAAAWAAQASSASTSTS